MKIINTYSLDICKFTDIMYILGYVSVSVKVQNSKT